MDVSALAVLDRAERQARERRLKASAEADSILEEGRRQVAAIGSTVPARIEAALAELRQRHEREADAAIADLGSRDQAPGEVSVPLDLDDPRFRQAVELVVAAVLGESTHASAEPMAGAVEIPTGPPAEVEELS